MDLGVVGNGLSTLGKGMGHGLIAKARELEVKLPAELNDPGTELTPKLIVGAIRGVAAHFFPLLGADAAEPEGARDQSAPRS
jgi:hypothetical protein